MGCMQSSLKELNEKVKALESAVESQKAKLEAAEKELASLKSASKSPEPSGQASAVDRVLVLGSTGYIGKQTVAELAKRGAVVFAGMRDLSKAKTAGFESTPGVTPIQVHMGSKEEVSKTIRDKMITKVYVIPPGAETRTEVSVNAIEGAKAAGGVKHLLLLSVLSASESETLFSKQFMPIEQAAAGSGIPFTIIRLPLFTDNIFAQMEPIKGTQKFYGPFLGTVRFSTVTTADAGLAAAELISSPEKHHGKTYNLCSDTYSQDDVAEAFTEALGLKVEYVQVPYDAVKQSFMALGFPEWQVDGIMELYKMIEEKRPVMSTSSADLSMVLGRAPTSTVDFVKAVGLMFKPEASPAKQ